MAKLTLVLRREHMKRKHGLPLTSDLQPRDLLKAKIRAKIRAKLRKQRNTFVKV